MNRSLPVAAAAVLATGILLAGCQSQSLSCTNAGGCQVTVGGAGQTVVLDSYDARLTVMSIDKGSVTMNANGGGFVRLADGQSAQVGPVNVTITSIKGDTVKFDVH